MFRPDAEKMLSKVCATILTDFIVEQQVPPTWPHLEDCGLVPKESSVSRDSTNKVSHSDGISSDDEGFEQDPPPLMDDTPVCLSWPQRRWQPPQQDDADVLWQQLAMVQERLQQREQQLLLTLQRKKVRRLQQRQQPPKQEPGAAPQLRSAPQSTPWRCLSTIPKAPAVTPSPAAPPRPAGQGPTTSRDVLRLKGNAVLTSMSQEMASSFDKTLGKSSGQAPKLQAPPGLFLEPTQYKVHY